MAGEPVTLLIVPSSPGLADTTVSGVGVLPAINFEESLKERYNGSQRIERSIVMAGIDNLDAYGQLTKAAKAAGGMEKLIANLESAAVSRVAMGLRAQGAAVTALGVGLFGAAYKFYQRKKRSNIATQETARAELREAVEDEERQDGDGVAD